MIAIVLAGVIVDRAALTFRTLAAAAIVVLLLAPQAVVHPSFQMSFAATLALVATYQRTLPWYPDRESSLSHRVALWGVRELLALLLASYALFWRLMGDGIDWMIRVALWVSSLPGAVGRMPAFGTGPCSPVRPACCLSACCARRFGGLERSC